MAVAVVSALAAAAFFALASALQHSSATASPEFGGFNPRGLARFVHQTLTHPSWLAGLAADAVGLGLHALALNEGPLTLVQPLLVAGVVFALPMRQLLDRRRPARREIAWAALLAAGLITFLVAATPTSATKLPADHVPAAVAAVLIAVAIAAAAGLGRRCQGTTGAAVLGLGAGIGFAGTAAALKAVTDTFPRGAGALFTTWPLYLLLAAGTAGLLLNQLAFQAGPLRASLPAISTVDPLVSLVIGVAVYDELLRGGVAALSAEVVGLGVVLLAAVVLSRSEASADPCPPGDVRP